MTGYNPVLFDSNILVYAHNSESPFYQQARQLHEKVVSRELSAVLAPQNLLEFYSTVTNRTRVERALGQTKAIEEISKYLTYGFELITPKGIELQTALALTEGKRILDRMIFDAYLVATMLSNGVTTIYTHNEKDFKIFDEIEVVNPFK